MVLESLVSLAEILVLQSMCWIWAFVVGSIFFFLFPLPLETLSFLCHLLPTGSAFSAVALCFLLSLPVPQISTLYVLDTSILTHCLYLSLI